ncbi:MAG: VOC family protein [Firmicutes bacterium]|nr:VOC family protein [Bacillota bacterium]
MYELAHIAIVIDDIDKTKKFYCNVLDCKFHSEDENDRLKFLYLKSGEQIIEFLKYKQPFEKRERGPIDHIAFKVEDMEKAIEKAKEYGGVMLFDEPRKHNDTRIMFFKGPNGERIEFIEK